MLCYSFPSLESERARKPGSVCSLEFLARGKRCPYIFFQTLHNHMAHCAFLVMLTKWNSTVLVTRLLMCFHNLALSVLRSYLPIDQKLGNC